MQLNGFGSQGLDTLGLVINHSYFELTPTFMDRVLAVAPAQDFVVEPVSLDQPKL